MLISEGPAMAQPVTAASRFRS